jgi:hypothetical protein
MMKKMSALLTLPRRIFHGAPYGRGALANFLTLKASTGSKTHSRRSKTHGEIQILADRPCKSGV